MCHAANASAKKQHDPCDPTWAAKNVFVTGIEANSIEHTATTARSEGSAPRKRSRASPKLSKSRAHAAREPAPRRTVLGRPTAGRLVALRCLSPLSENPDHAERGWVDDPRAASHLHNSSSGDRWAVVMCGRTCSARV